MEIRPTSGTLQSQALPPMRDPAPAPFGSERGVWALMLNRARRPHPNHPPKAGRSETRGFAFERKASCISARI